MRIDALDSVITMSDPLQPLRLNALELMRQPGTERTIEIQVTAADLDVDHPDLRGDVGVLYDLESLDDGIMVKGTATIAWSGHCRRCLRLLNGAEVVMVDEIHQRELIDPDAFPIENNQLNLAPMTRESVLLALDTERLCRPDCAGLCPLCGINRNEGHCACDTTVRDNRWAALDELSLDE